MTGSTSTADNYSCSMTASITVLNATVNFYEDYDDILILPPSKPSRIKKSRAIVPKKIIVKRIPQYCKRSG